MALKSLCQPYIATSATTANTGKPRRAKPRMISLSAEGKRHASRAIRFLSAVASGPACGRGEVERGGTLQFHRRQQRSRADPGRRARGGGDRRALARGPDACELWPQEWTAGLPAAA